MSTLMKKNIDKIRIALMEWNDDSGLLSLSSLSRKTDLSLITVRKRTRDTEDIKELYWEKYETFGRDVIQSRAKVRKRKPYDFTPEFRQYLANSLREMRLAQGRKKEAQIRKALDEWNPIFKLTMSELARAIDTSYQGIYANFKRLPELREAFEAKKKELNQNG